APTGAAANRQRRRRRGGEGGTRCPRPLARAGRRARATAQVDYRPRTLGRLRAATVGPGRIIAVLVLYHSTPSHAKLGCYHFPLESRSTRPSLCVRGGGRGRATHEHASCSGATRATVAREAAHASWAGRT